MFEYLKRHVNFKRDWQIIAYQSLPYLRNIKSFYDVINLCGRQTLACSLKLQNSVTLLLKSTMTFKFSALSLLRDAW